jgi:hypothetical protein
LRPVATLLSAQEVAVGLQEARVPKLKDEGEK